MDEQIAALPKRKPARKRSPPPEPAGPRIRPARPKERTGPLGPKPDRARSTRRSALWPRPRGAIATSVRHWPSVCRSSNASSAGSSADTPPKWQNRRRKCKSLNRGISMRSRNGGISDAPSSHRGFGMAIFASLRTRRSTVAKAAENASPAHQA